MTFAGAMNLSIDKDEFWQLPSDGPTAASPPPASAIPGAFSEELRDTQAHAAPRFSTDSSFFDQYVDMEMKGTAGTLAEGEADHSPGESFLVPLSPHKHGYGQEEQGLELEGDALSRPASASPAPEFLSVSGTASPHHTYMEDDDQSVDMMSIATSIPSIDGSAKSRTPFPSQGQTAPRQDGDPTNHVVLGRLNPETLEQRRRLLSGRRGMGHHQPTGGSISDSELLRLEGLSVNSPRGMIVAASAARNVPSPSSQTQTHPQPQLRRSIITPSTSTPTFTSTSTPPHTGGFPLVTSKSYNNLTGRYTGGNQATAADDIDLCNLGDRRQHFKAAGSRKFESIYATIRRAVGGGHRTRLNHSNSNNNNNNHQQPKTAPIPQTAVPSHIGPAKKPTPSRLASETSQLMWDGLPISPPLTDMNSHRHQGHQGHQGHHGHHPGDPATFVAGLMDDPFFDSSLAFANSHHHHPGLASAAELNGKSAAFNANIPNTPLHTPNIKAETIGNDGANYFPITGKPWSLDNGSFVTSSDMTNEASFLSNDGTVMDAWSFDPSSDSGSNMDFTTTNDANSSHHRNHHNLTIQVPSFMNHDPHHTPGSDDLAGTGLMIHMPQPHTPNTGPLLSSQIHQTHNGIPLHDATVFPFPDGTGTPQHHMHYLQQQQQQQPQSQSRRPKPRAPSSGARYHNHLPGAHSISPRKTRQPSNSSSESPSPTPGAQQQQQQQQGGGRRSRSASRRQASVSGGSGLAHRKSTTDLLVTGSSFDTQSHAVRKRRSTSSWRGSRRSGSGDMGAGGPGLGGISLDGANGGLGFVNYTPNDHNVLMTGVAPSGSSKTKMRREKEALEKQRKMSEVMAKIATNAGVDVAMLKEKGIVI